jgi:hypothetical protein
VIQLPERPTGEQLYEAMRDAAASKGVSLHRLAALLFPNGPGWKLEQMRIARAPKPVTVERVRCLINGDLPPLPETITRQARAAAGMPPSRRELKERRMLHGQQQARDALERRIALSRRAHDVKLPGESLHAAVQRLEQDPRP